MTIAQTKASAALPHRPDIDGLRSFAILPVVAYHAGVHMLRGGFVGVDIFFVISGFLITQVLARDFQANRFSLVAFYERRVRRILPALIVVLLATFFAYLYYSLPAEFVDFSKSQIAAALSVSNVFYWLTSGYFDAASSDRPLLQTWSLGVEEQFYIFWPLLLYMGYRWFRSRILLAVTVLTVVSFLISVYGVFHDRSGAFYLVHTRAWELFGGAMLSIGAFSAPLGRTSRELLGAAGLVLILGSVFLIDQFMPFPGLAALPPCVGAALVILAGRDGDSLVARLMSWRPLVFIGLISYSLYLWHWPITVFQHNYAFLLSGGSEKSRKLAMIGVSLVMATLSWYFVEQPFRFGPCRPNRQKLFRYALLATLLVVALGMSGVATGGFPHRYSPRELWIATYRDKLNIFRSNECFVFARTGPTAQLAPKCLQSDPARANYLLLGDSHAAELWYGLQQVYPQIHFLQATAADCFPTIVHNLAESTHCSQVLDAALHDAMGAKAPNRVILAARWRPDTLGNLLQTVQALKQHGIAVTVIGPTLVFDSPFPRLLVTAGRSRDPKFLDRHWDHTLQAMDQLMAAQVRSAGAEYVSMIELATQHANVVAYADDGTPMLLDQEHYNAGGAVLMARRIQASVPWPENSAPPSQ